MNRLLARLRAADLHEALEIPAEDRALPERAHQGPELLFAVGVALRRDAVVHPASLAPMLDDACHAQDSEVSGDMRLREPKGVLEVAHAQLAVREQRHDSETGLVAESLEQTREGTDVDRLR